MDFKGIITEVEDSGDFKEFLKKYPHYYLVHVFRVIDGEHDSVWQIGYYSKDTDKIVVFEYDENDDKVSVHPEAEALKKDEYIQKLDLKDVKVSLENATDIVDEAVKEHYHKELPSKRILLLQNLPEFGQVWNVTIVTLAFSVINIKIDAASGKVLKHTKENLMNWRSNPE